MPGRKEYRGASGILSLTGPISSGVTSIQADGDATGWPSGVTWPFVIRIDAGSANEEKILCASMTPGLPNLINVLARGYDGTLAISHSAGAPVQHCLDADSCDTWSDHVFNTTRDDHLQYIRTDGSRGFSGLSGVAGIPVAVGTALAQGSSNLLARADHVHRLANGAVDLSSVFAPQVVDNAAIKNLAVSAAKIANKTITAAQVADNTLTALQIAPSAITTNELADGTITYVDMNSGNVKTARVCTSSTRPGSPLVGDIIYESDTKNFMEYASSTTGWVPLWNQAWGALGGTTARNNATTSQNNLGSGGTDLVGAPVLSFTTVANRWTRIVAHVPLIVKHTYGNVKIWITVDSGGNRTTIHNTTMGDGTRDAADGVMIVNLAAGAHTAQLAVNCDIGSVDLPATTYGNGDPGPVMMFAEDAGVYTAPA